MSIEYREIANRDALGLAELVRAGQISPRELLDATLERAAEVNPVVNAVVIDTREVAAEQLASLPPDAPFGGVPFLLKDATGMLEGSRLTVGCRALRDNVCDCDSTLVARSRRAGLVFAGKTSCPEFALLPTTEPLLWGPTRNPWALEHSAGGSSGGAATAVAAGIVPMAHASDGGGSIRVPASCCGVFGLKPSRARLPTGPLYTDLSMGSVSEGVITRTVRDSAAFLDAVEGPEPGDPVRAPAHERPFRQEVEREPGALRIAFTTAGMLGAEVHRDCASAVRDAAMLCAVLGHEVIDDFPSLDVEALVEAFEGGLCVAPAGRIRMLESVFGRRFGDDDVEPLTRDLAAMGRSHPATSVGAWQQQIGIAIRQVGYFMEEQRLDLLLTPVTSRPAPPLGWFAPGAEGPCVALRRIGEYLQFTWLWNSAGVPAMSLPLHWTAEGCPVGVQFVGRLGTEPLLFGLAGQLERARPWAGRRPELPRGSR